MKRLYVCLYKHINIDDTIVHLGTNGRFFDDTFDFSHFLAKPLKIEDD